jgi:hypothetical protein
MLTQCPKYVLSGLDSGIGGGESGSSTLQYMEKQNHNVGPNQPLAFWRLMSMFAKLLNICCEHQQPFCEFAILKILSSQ